MNLLKKNHWYLCLSIATVTMWLTGQQAYAYASNTPGYVGAGQAFPAEIGRGTLVGSSDSEHVILSASSDETDLAECYGDELEVALRSVIDADGTVLEHTVFAFPNPSGWLVTVHGTGGQLLNFLPCQVEPINATGLWGGFIDPRLGHRKFSIPGTEGVRVRSVRFSSPGTKAAEGSETRRNGTILQEGVEVSDGFVRRSGENATPISGGWLFPENYTSPIGTRIRMSCGSKTCSVQYRMRQNLQVRYELWIEDNSAPPDWILIDQYVREVIVSWIEQN